MTSFGGGLQSLLEGDYNLLHVDLTQPRAFTNYREEDFPKQISQSGEFISLKEVILQVSIYHPIRPRKTFEFLVLGSTKLSELRDKIYCLSDHVLDASQRKSGFFFINNTFYNDTRIPENYIYSKFILDWLNEKNRATHQLKEKKMEDTYFRDLKISLGEKYLYCHQGSCEHFIVFEQLRMVNERDEPDPKKYPLILFQMKHRRRKCRVCEIYPAKYVTLGDQYCDETPFFYCDECYKGFHYTKGGILLYSNYQVFQYYHE
ncbi:hypothetical protein DICPUDRAFT_35181 [Dictyostelium purpureum]|uniref:snRNA-activating protein complex subunit 3 n=1 Tax=Dictyostelium purpureum TaxID=5786 RepID=F0ZNX8_DICPU|nr:uncharacterized protein DICPUDRAFT_35181 [Dictyostelium purpureum]EGC34328.1 hypothetical protein DICPUDRAFT_35181 [Dictyostelium purpureum]|eukprot:XP_003289121.1 hypothetical protein DICPUDRAFT_35181 [Dictyostelium purpureum]